MESIDLSGLNIDQLTDLVGKAQSEMASRERHCRKDLRSELERRVPARFHDDVRTHWLVLADWLTLMPIRSR